MSYTQLLRTLVSCSVTTTSHKSIHRQIIHFKNRREFNRFIRQSQHDAASQRLKSSIRKLRLINSILFQGKPLPSFHHRGIRMIESDDRIHMQRASSVRHSQKRRTRSKRSKPSMEHIYEKQSVTPAGTIPWGVRHIRAPYAWRRSIGSSVKVAVIDTGVDYRHPDLKASLAPGLNLLHPGMPPWDDNGHGTHICGTLAGVSYQNKGIWGIAPGAIIIPIKAFDRYGSAYVSDIIQALDWCVRHRIRLINMSFGMNSASSAFRRAVQIACAKGTIIVASAGNDGKRVLDYPAQYRNTIAVGAINRKGKIAKFSNRTKRIHIYAPGQSISSTWLNKGYAQLSGTSMATSHVSGAIALALSLRPNLSPLMIKKLLLRTGKPLKGKSSSSTCMKEIDAWRLVQTVLRM